MEHRHVVLRSAGGDEAELDLAIFLNKDAALRVIDDAEADDGLAATMQKENCIAGVNGGYFDPNYAPVGLLVSDGRVVTPLQKAKLLSGVVSVVKGRVRVERVASFSMKAKPSAARQCGPFLVENGKAVANLNNSRAARRTFVASLGGDRAAVGYCSSVTLAELADLLAAPALQTQRALNMDGGSSSGFWFAGENGVVYRREGKTVRDYIAVMPK